MSTIRVTVEVPELSETDRGALRAIANGESPQWSVATEIAAQHFGLIDERLRLTPPGRAVLEHYGEGGR